MTPKWKHYYTRPTRAQDSIIPLAMPLVKKGIVSECMYIFCEGKWEAWYKHQEFDVFFEKLGKEIIDDSWTLKKHLKNFGKASKKLLGSAQNLAKISRTNDKKLILAAYKNYIHAYYDFSPFIWTPWAITHWLEDWFVAKLSKKFKDWQEIYEKLAIPSKLIGTERLEKALLKWKITGEKQDGLTKIAKKFGFLAAYSVNDPVWNESDLKKQANQFDNPQQKLSELEKIATENRKNAKLALKTLKKDPLLAKIGHVLHIYTWLRTERIDIYKRALVTVQPFYRWFEQEFELPKFWAGHFSYDEIADALEKNKLPPIKKLQDRAHFGYVVHIGANKTTIIAKPEEQIRFVRRFIPKYGEFDGNEVHGKTAFPGIVTGKVRRILKLSEIDKMRVGEILVANMTHPDFMPAIRKAAAIVTDEGGIVCHAAIVSRELKIPCVIACGKATKIFKDGDMIKVDAKNGVVTLLSNQITK